MIISLLFPAAVAALVMAVVGVLGNSLTVIALMRDRKLKRKATTSE